MTSRLKALLVLCALVLCIGFQHTAEAQSADAEAHYIQAIDLFNKGQYREALTSFDRAIAIEPNPVFYCNRATVLVKLKDFEEGIRSMETCADGFKDNPTESASINAELSAMKLAVRDVAASARGVATRTLTPQPQVVVEQSDTTSTVGWSLIGAGAASLSVAFALDLLTAPDIDEYKEVARKGTDEARYNALKSDLDERRLQIGVLVGAGAGALAIGTIILLLDDESEPSQSGLFVRPGTQHIMSGYQGTF